MFAFLAYDDIGPWYHATASAAGTAPLDLTTVAEDIAAARAIADNVVVVPHWGIEYTAAPSERQRQAARIMAEAGADLVIGNHAHWVQAHERIGGTFVAYALGNFVFDQDWSLETQQGAMLEVTFTETRDVCFLRGHAELNTASQEPAGAGLVGRGPPPGTVRGPGGQPQKRRITSSM